MMTDSIRSLVHRQIFFAKNRAMLFAPRNQYALEIDDKLEPPMFRITDTHYAATWLLDPRAPKVEMPEELRVRIERMKKEAEEYED